MADSVIHVTIHGRVQGVGYRAWMAREASRLGLSGWVRNRQDGTVEATIGGDPDGVAELLAMARCGPAIASVSHVDVNPGSVVPDTGFLIGDTV